MHEKFGKIHNQIQRSFNRSVLPSIALASAAKQHARAEQSVHSLRLYLGSCLRSHCTGCSTKMRKDLVHEDHTAARSSVCTEKSLYTEKGSQKIANCDQYENLNTHVDASRAAESFLFANRIFRWQIARQLHVRAPKKATSSERLDSSSM